MNTFLKDTHFEIWQELDRTKNGDLNLDRLTTSNPKEVWWLCPKGHSWKKAPSERTRIRISKLTGKQVNGARCPICANKQVLPGYNDLATQNPALAAQWHPTLNGNITPKDITAGSSKKAWWICDKGHEWEASPYTRNRTESGCGVCMNNSVLPGYNDLASTNKLVASQWHPTLNGDLTPRDITKGANRKVWWMCEKGHEWEAVVSSRTSDTTRQRNCPVCANKKVLEGDNDLKTTHPELIKEISLTLNPELKIESLHKGSSVYVTWTCSNNPNHTWATTVAKRAVEGQGCPSCSNRNSKPEEEVYQFILSLVPDETKILRHVRNILTGGKEIDIFIPDYNFAIEYNGLYWHSENKVGRNIHYKKWKELKEQNIQLFTVWEDHWLENKDLIQRMIAAKMGLNKDGSVYARKTQAKIITNQEAKVFLQRNHLQGHVNSTKFYGLLDENNQILSVIGVKFNKNKKVLEISRFASSKQVVGGFSKLLKTALKDFPETTEVLSYSDNSTSNGNLYRATNFKEENDNIRSYFYAIQQKRIHRLHYTKTRYKEDDNLQYQENLTERELADLNGLDRVWDAGNTKWVMKLT